jgi:hypothetical protein
MARQASGIGTSDLGLKLATLTAGAAFAANFGGGLDMRVNRRFSLRLAEVDYLLTTRTTSASAPAWSCISDKKQELKLNKTKDSPEVCASPPFRQKQGHRKDGARRSSLS